jgi:hypothetical protein
VEKAGTVVKTNFWLGILLRYLLVYASFSIGATLFSNWRLFPSLDLSVFSENWGKFVFYTLWVGVPHLLIAYCFTYLLQARLRFQRNYTVDLLFAAVFLIKPISLLLQLLLYNDRSTFSFGISEGEIIRDNVVTELGRRYFFMNKMAEVFHMLIFLTLRFVTGFTRLNRFF